MPVYHYDENGKLIGKSISSGERFLGFIGLVFVLAAIAIFGYWIYEDVADSVGREKLNDTLLNVFTGVLLVTLILAIIGIVFWIRNIIRDGWKGSFSSLPRIFIIFIALWLGLLIMVLPPVIAALFQ